MSTISTTPSPLSVPRSPSIDPRADQTDTDTELERAIGCLDLLDKSWFNCVFACIGAVTACYCCCCCCWFCCNKICCNFCCGMLAPTQRSTKYDKFFDRLNMKIAGGEADKSGTNHIEQPVLRQPRGLNDDNQLRVVELQPTNHLVTDDEDSALSAL